MRVEAVRSANDASRSLPPVHAPPKKRMGCYVLDAEIGVGRTEAVHLGRLLGAGGFTRTVAIKRLRLPFAGDPELVAGFVARARRVARIRHPNVVPTLDIVTSAGEVFVVTEYVLGHSLYDVLRSCKSRRQAVPPSIAFAVIVGVLEGLHAAHEACDELGEPLGIVHGAVSPHNILVGTDGAPHLIDFCGAGPHGRSQNEPGGAVRPKASYTAPWLRGDARLDRRADVFAASVVLREMLSGNGLLRRAGVPHAAAGVRRPKVDLRRPPAGGADAIDMVVLRGLGRDAARRYSTALEMARELAAVAPIARPSEVAGWLDGLLGKVIAKRARPPSPIERDGARERADEGARASEPTLRLCARRKTSDGGEEFGTRVPDFQPGMDGCKTTRTGRGGPTIPAAPLHDGSAWGDLLRRIPLARDRFVAAFRRSRRGRVAVLIAAVVLLGMAAVQARSRVSTLARSSRSVANRGELRTGAASPPAVGRLDAPPTFDGVPREGPSPGGQATRDAARATIASPTCTRECPDAMASDDTLPEAHRAASTAPARHRSIRSRDAARR